MIDCARRVSHVRVKDPTICICGYSRFDNCLWARRARRVRRNGAGAAGAFGGAPYKATARTR
eukprot:7609916-Pyramimonas_sp.AAC.1